MRIVHLEQKTLQFHSESSKDALANGNNIVNSMYGEELNTPIVKYAPQIVDKFEVEYFNSLASAPKWVQEELVKVIEEQGFEAFVREICSKRRKY
jgi:hypothetical protein